MAVPIFYKAHQCAWSSGHDSFFPELASWDRISAAPESKSCLNSSGQNAKLHADVANAVLGYISAQNPDPTKRTSIYTLVKIADGVYGSEQPILDSSGAPTGKCILARANSTGQFQAAVVSPPNITASLPAISTPELNDQKNYPLEGIYAMFLMMTCELNQESKNDLTTLENELVIGGKGNVDLTVPKPELYRLCDAVYYAMEKKAINPSIPGSSIDPLTYRTISNGTCFGTILCGPQPRYLFGANANRPQEKATVTMAEAKAMFKDWREKQSWSEYDRQFIPVFPDDYKVLPEAIRFAKLFVATHENRRPMVNFMWRGITSYGKSTGVETIAAMLDMPYLWITCHTDMETNNFLSEWVPDTGTRVVDTLPSFEEIAYDPESAYEALTGEFLADATPQDCLAAYAEAVSAKTMGTSGTPRYKLVESNFVKALRKGYICEVQEISRIRDSGVLVGINQYDRPGCRIPLADGSFTTRHPDAMVIFTDNVGYASCRSVDPSAIRRNAFIIDSYKLEKKQVLDRVIYNTGFSDTTMLDMMYDLWEKIQEYCKEKDITEGSVSVTELEMWCLAALADGMSNLKQSCRECIVAKATSDISEQDEIVTSVVNHSPLF